MLFLLVVPVLLVVAATQRYLAMYAPSNVLIRNVRVSHARLRTAAGLAALAGVLLAATRAIHNGISAGAPGWLNLVVLILAWDAIKIGTAAVITACRLPYALVHRKASETRNLRS